MMTGTMEYEIGGGWGDSIEWFGPEQFDDRPITDESKFQVVGWKARRPKISDTLKGEFEKSWVWFKFVSVDYKSNPPDMFFATVTPIKQEVK